MSLWSSSKSFIIHASNDVLTIFCSGTEYPVNSIDLSRVTNLGNFSDGTNQTICVNSFVPGDESSEGVDIILGDSFMRNVYAVFNFGNWTNATAGATPPYMQLLSVSL